MTLIKIKTGSCGDVSGELGSVGAQFGHLVVLKNCAGEKAAVTAERIESSSC